MGRHEDERGVIQDLLGPVGVVTEIVTRKGAIRGNHVHFETIQWTYIVSGRMRIVTGDPSGKVTDIVYKPGDMACELQGVAHAWQALEDCTCLVFTRGPRSGEDYESDTYRLTGPDRLIVP